MHLAVSILTNLHASALRCVKFTLQWKADALHEPHLLLDTI